MKTLLIANRKGGVGKTTTALNLAGGFARSGKRVLLIDLDTQANLTRFFRIKSEEGIHSALVKKEALPIVKTKYENIDLVPSDVNFDISAFYEDELRSDVLISKIERKLLLRRSFNKTPQLSRYEICIIDTSPAFDILLVNALKVCGFVIVPVQTDYLGLSGLKQFLAILQKTLAKENKTAKFLGVVPTMFSSTIKKHKEFLQQMENIVGKERVFKPIRKDFKLVEMYEEGEILVLTEKRSRAKKDYLELCKQIATALSLI